MEHIALIFGAGLLAGTMNAVAGGGSFITFPALISAGVPPIVANASSTVALFPASLSSAWEYRKHVQPFPKVTMSAMLIVTFLGGLLGSVLLLATPPKEFSLLVPWLLLTGSVAFAFGRSWGNRLRQHIDIGPTVLLLSQFLLGIYGGYFGGAVGIMMMAVWSIFGFSNIWVTNANKNLFVGVANAIAVVIFIVAGKVAWEATCYMLTGTILGGVLGARYSQRVNPQILLLCYYLFQFFHYTPLLYQNLLVIP